MSYATVTATAGINIPAADINQLFDNTEAMLDGSKNFQQVTFENTSATAGLHTETGVLKFGDATIATGAASTGNATQIQGIDVWATAPTSGQILKFNSTANEYQTVADAGGGGATLTDYEIDFPVGVWDLPSSNAPEPVEDTGTNGEIIVYGFDDTTEEFTHAQLQLPAGLGSGTVTFEAVGYSKTATASKNIALKFYHSAIADGESWDAVYASTESGDKATDSTQDNLEFHSWSTTVSSLGWSASDSLRVKFSRIQASVNNLSGDWYLKSFRIKAPRS